jgi:hypothetical protein
MNKSQDDVDKKSRMLMEVTPLQTAFIFGESSKLLIKFILDRGKEGK